MKLIVLVATAPLALTACKPAPIGATNNSSVATPEVVPDAVTVNGVTYTRAGSAGPATAPTPLASPTIPAPTVAPTPSDSSGEPPTSGTSRHGD